MSHIRSEDRPAWNERQDEDAVIESACAILERRLSRDGVEALPSPVEAGKYAKLKLQSHQREVFAALFMDTRHRLIAFEELFYGTVDGAEIHPREIVKRALALNAVAIICAHNHPSGNAEPSAADRAVTARLKQALALVDIRLLDHFVIGEGPPVSMAARGWV